ncbi:hypothetical protein J0H58_39145 [bacterium]|nr:hypothetical protein [bacterium]
MTVDARDTVVQRDPGQLARDVLGDPSRVLVTAEPITVCQQPWNMTERDKWQADRLPVYRPEARVINGGFAAGRPNVLRWFCLARWCLDFAHQASDQAGVTALADWLKGWPSLVVSTHADGLVGHGFHWQQPGFDPARFAIFHQWDRTPWANAVRKAYPAGSTV